MNPDLGPVDEFDLGDMPIENFRNHGYEFVDWMCSYLDDINKFPVLSKSEPGEIKNSLAYLPPESGEDIEKILKDFDKIIMPGITHWNHPGFFAYFSTTSSAPAILGEMLSATLNVNCMLWKTSPAATELEEKTAEWLRMMLNLPGDFFGMIVDTASAASLVALAAARENLTDLNIRMKGYPSGENAKPLRVYCSDQAHSSIDKAAIVLGIGLENVVKIESDENFRMRPGLLEKKIEEDMKNGYRPMAVVATIGTTSTTSIDPVKEIGAICEKHGIWFHVDGAYGGIYSIIPEYRDLTDGFEFVDSYVTNPHKCLYVPIDLSMFYFRRPEIVKRAFSVVPEYLTTPESGEVTDYMNYGIQLGRSFRAVKLWFVLRYFGRQGIINRLRENIRLGRLMKSLVEKHNKFELMAPVPFSTVCFRYNPGLRNENKIAEINEKLMNNVNNTGKIFISHTKLKGKYSLRFAIGNIKTTELHIRNAWKLFCKCADEL